MDFDAVLDQVRELLRQRKRLSYQALKRRFALDEAYLDDLKVELIEAEQVAADENGRILVWTGNEEATSAQPRASFDSASDQPPSPRTSPEAERRQLTVMFCDLVGSTPLAEKLDPEELRQVLLAYQDASARVIEQFEGHLARYVGDGLLVYFGYPLAHDNEGQRAVQAGLGIVSAVQQLNSQLCPTVPVLQAQPLQVRIGIHTGLVVVGEMGGGRFRDPQAIVGETPNIAARLQGRAEPDTLVISAATYRLVEGLFECRDWGLQALKGVSTPLRVYQVRGESRVGSRFEVAVHMGLTPLVGREEELGFLFKRWERAKAGEGQIVLLSGEPGIGKSRLVQELKDQLAHEGMTRIEFRCSPYHQNSALYPIIEHLQQLFQFERDDSPATKLEKLQHTLSHYRFPQADTVPLLAALLSLPHPEGSPAITVSPQKQKELTQAALIAWLLEETERQPVYNAWEDLHWADPSTLEVLDLLLSQVPTARWLVVLTYRPEFVPSWGTHSYVSQLTLNRLGHQQVSTLVARVTGGKALPKEVVQQIATKTDGVPLFVEELTKMVVESNLVHAVNNHYELTGPLPPLAIPSTLQDSLMARLDRLATAKAIAQLGATIGREFSYEVISAVSPLGADSLQQGLTQLVDAELVYQRGVPPQARYLFKHALIQDTAYHTLLKRTRQQYHHKIAELFEARFPETVETQPELVAHHYTEARLLEPAIRYWRKAGQRASERSAHTEAIAHLTTGLELLKTLPDTPERAQQEVRLQLALSTPLIATKGYTAPEVDTACNRARELCQQIGETPRLFSVLGGLCSVYMNRAELRTALELAEQMFRLAQGTQDPRWLLWAHYALGSCLWAQGELIAARTHFEKSLAFYDLHQAGSYGWVQDPGVSCLSDVGQVLWLLGYPDLARKRIKEALALARELSHPFSLARALMHAAIVLSWCGERRAAPGLIEEIAMLAHEQGFRYWQDWAMFHGGMLLVEQGQAAEGIAQMRQGLTNLRTSGTVLERPIHLGYLAEAYGKAGQPAEGLNALAESFAVVDNNEKYFRNAAQYRHNRLKGELLLQKLLISSSTVQVTHPQNLTPHAQAEAEVEACFLQAIDIACHHEAKSWELRAATSLARLWQQQGKTTEARDLLAPVYHWFTEGFDTKDLQEAEALLTELA